MYEDCQVQNFAPHQDVICITIGDFVISIAREDGGEVVVCITDNQEGSEQTMALGQPGYTQRL